MQSIVLHLIAKYPLISDQINKEQLREILLHLEKTIDRKVAGDVVEFGCYIGTTSLFLRRLLLEHSTEKVLHVYDSFEGLPAKSTWDASATGEDFTAGALRVSKKDLLREFHKANVAPPIVHKGWFSDLTDVDVPEQIAFAFLDGDFYDSIQGSLALVLPRMSKGGVIVVDDYAREALPGAARAVHERFHPDQVRTVHNLGIIQL